MTRNGNLRMISNFLGVCAYTFTMSVHVYWGNLSVYVASYARHRAASDKDVNTPWVVSIIFIGWSITMALAGYVADFLGHKWTIVLGGCFLQAGVLSGYFFIQHSLVAFNFIFGILVGFGSGLLNCIGLQSVLSYKPKYPGILTAVTTSCISGGAVILNQIITWYINPNNLTPDLRNGLDNYFTQPEVLDKLPMVFFVIGGFNLCCYVIGTFLLKPKEGKGDNGADNGKSELQGEDPVMSTDGKYETNEISNGVAASQTSASDQYVTNDLKPREVLKTKIFYVLWFSLGVADLAAIVHFNFYKIYGQIWIHDDHFLATLASSMALAMAVARLVWGLVIEKCGVKYSVIFLSSALTVTPSLWYFSPMAGRWFYLVWTTLYGCFAGGVYIVYPVAALRLFGSDHFSHNFGMVMTCRLVVNLAAPLLMEFIVTGCGYFYLFVGVGCLNIVGMALMMRFMPRL